MSSEEKKVKPKKILKWHCEKCNGFWRENEVKRTKYEFCPRCSPNRERTAKVTYVEKKEIKEKEIPKEEKKEIEKEIPKEEKKEIPEENVCCICFDSTD